jgi:myo-inositol-1(or 4)-monophosphatase
MTVRLTNLEQAALGAATSLEAGGLGRSEVERWLSFSLKATFDGCARLRSARIRAGRPGFFLKDDGSPSTRIELEVEQELRSNVTAFSPDAIFVGEETGGSLAITGTTVAVDPVDGTWSYISGTETCSMTIAVFIDGEIVAGVIGSPVTGEIAYASTETGARVVQVGFLTSETEGAPLPVYEEDGPTILVNMHPTRQAGPVMNAMYRAWSENQVRLVRSTGGSPSWALVDVAKGLFTYASLWAKRVAEPFDLAAGCLIVRSAGGEVVDLEGRPIHPENHIGPFVAGVRPEAREKVRHLLRRTLGS